MVPSLEEAIERMSARFALAGRQLAPWPEAPGHPEEEIAAVEARLGVRLPPTFREVIARYDFLRAVVGNVSMSHASSVEEWLVDLNSDPPKATAVRWWRAARRPQNLLLIGHSDAHSFLLDTNTGAVKAIWVDDASATPHAVASSFPDFYRGLATVYLAGLGSDEAKAAAEDVSDTVGASKEMPFWSRFAVRAA